MSLIEVRHYIENHKELVNSVLLDLINNKWHSCQVL